MKGGRAVTALRKYRELKGLTQDYVAKKLGVKPNCINQWESGVRKPDIIKLKKLAHILGCTTDELLEPIQI